MTRSPVWVWGSREGTRPHDTESSGRGGCSAGRQLPGEGASPAQPQAGPGTSRERHVCGREGGSRVREGWAHGPGGWGFPEHCGPGGPGRLVKLVGFSVPKREGGAVTADKEPRTLRLMPLMLPGISACHMGKSPQTDTPARRPHPGEPPRCAARTP